MGLFISTEGRVTTMTPRNGKDFSLKELQTAVGGYIETLRMTYHDASDTPRTGWLVVNEEGKLQGLPPNLMASMIVVGAGINDSIVGNAVFCEEGELK